jgi:hypothetical protein
MGSKVPVAAASACWDARISNSQTLFSSSCEGAAGGFRYHNRSPDQLMGAARERRMPLDGCLLEVHEASLASRPLEGSREM